MGTTPYQFISGVDLIKTHGIEGAKEYAMGPNSRVAIFDDTEDVFYIKSTDNNSFPSLRKFRYTEEVMLDPNSSSGITLEDIRALMREEIKAFKEELLNEPTVSEQFGGAANTHSQTKQSQHSTNGSKSNGFYKQSATNTSAVESIKE